MCVTSERMMAQYQSCIHFSVRFCLPKHWQNLTMLLDDVGIDGFVLRCGGPEPSQVNVLARTLGSHDHAPRQIVRADPKTTRDGEILGNDEVVHDLMDVGARTVRVTERSMCEWCGHSASVNT